MRYSHSRLVAQDVVTIISTTIISVCHDPWSCWDRPTHPLSLGQSQPFDDSRWTPHGPLLPPTQQQQEFPRQRHFRCLLQAQDFIQSLTHPYHSSLFVAKATVLFTVYNYIKAGDYKQEAIMQVP